jgi:CRP-like cAMP-binding protein
MKLEQFTAFTADERRRLDELVAGAAKCFAARTDILKEGEKVDHIHIVLSGLGARYKLLPDGERQIMAFLIPGDLCDAEVFVLAEMDHSVGALTETRCALVATKAMEALLTESSQLTRALWWSTMTDSAVLRERIVDHGRRDARERVAHLFYEMLVRYRLIGQAVDGSFDFAVTQEELADATGLTPVHINRTLKQLREEGLVEFRGKSLRVLDPPGLKRAARFNPNYLHLDRTEDGDREVAGRAGDLV